VTLVLTMQLLVTLLCLAGGLLLVRRATASSMALGALLLLLACHLGVLACQELGWVRWRVTAAHLAGLAYGPLFALFVRDLLFVRDAGWTDRLPHAIPLIVYAVSFAAGILSGEALALGVFASLGAYLALAVVDVMRYRVIVEKTRSTVPRTPLAWLTFAVAGVIIAYALDVGAFLTGRAGPSAPSYVFEVLRYVALAAYVTAFVIAVLRYPQLFSTATLEDVDAASAADSGGDAARRPGAHRPDRSGAHLPPPASRPGVAADPSTTPTDRSLEPDRSERELQAIEAFMRERRPYLRSELGLPELAQELGVSARHLSQLVNRGRGRNFSDWVNRYRLHEAERLLADPESGIRSVLDAMYTAGFSSKSTFNALFKASTGVTPSEYMRQRRPESDRPEK
jgi:AraC-like DNA-binding protein